MLYKIQLVIGSIVATLFFLIGLALFISGIKGDGHSLFMGAIFLLVSSVTLFTLISRHKKFSIKTYHWYRKAYPDNVRSNKVSCFKCGSDRIHVRGLMNHTYHREHLCYQCGTALYYSPED